MQRRRVAALLPKAGSYALRYLRRQRRERLTPAVLSFLVTARCPLSCQHCFYHYADRSAAGELSLDEYRRLAASLDEFAVGLFCGGEPFVRPELAEIVELFQHDCGMLLPLVSTNGQLAGAVLRQTERMLRGTPEKPLMLSLSIDGFQEQHDHIRGAGSFQQALRCWRECQRLARHHANLILAVTTVVSSLNQDVAPRLVRWIWSELRPDNVAVLLVRQTPRAGPELKEVDPRQYWATQVEALRPMTRSRLWWLDHPQLPLLGTIAEGIVRTMTNGKRSFRCHAGRHGAVVDPAGRVHACEALAEYAEVGSLGSLRSVDMDFAALWNSREADAVRGWVGRHAVCTCCTHESMGYLPSLPFAGNRLRWSARRLVA